MTQLEYAMVLQAVSYIGDITSDKAALDCYLQTVGHMAQGLQNIYPVNHKKHRPRLEAHGGFVTDFWSTFEFKPFNFIRRNLLIAGLSEATEVIESADKDISLITADLAFGCNQKFLHCLAAPIILAVLLI